MTDITIPVPWGYISGKTFGEKKAIPVLCVHGRNDNLETFSQLMPLLPSNYYYVCIDLPGHGKSSHANTGYVLDLTWYSMTVKRVLDHFQWSKVYYLGHSLGGQIGFVLAALYPELMLKLIIIDTLMMNPANTQISVKSVRSYTFDLFLKLEQRSNIDAAPTYSFKEFMDKMKESRRTECSDEQLRPMAERNLIEIGPDQYKFSNDQRAKILGLVQNFTFEQLEKLSKEISSPTLLILGKDSLVTIPMSKITRTPLQNNHNVMIRVIDGDHDVHIAHAQEVAQLVVPFLKEGTVSKL